MTVIFAACSPLAIVLFSCGASISRIFVALVDLGHDGQDVFAVRLREELHIG